MGRPSLDRLVFNNRKTDPEVVPLPPHVTLKQARGFMSSMIKGDEATGHMIGETARQVFNGLLANETEKRSQAVIRYNITGR